MSSAVARFSPQQRLILRELSRGHLVTTAQLVQVLYGVARYDGGPSDPEHIVHQLLARMRPVLRGVGIAILTIGRTKGARGYRIDPDHVGDLAQLLDEIGRIDLNQARAHFIAQSLR